MKKPDEFSNIETERLVLRELRVNDLINYHKIFGNEEVVKYYGVIAKEKPEDLLKALERNISALKKKKFLCLGITIKGDNTIIGIIKFKYWETKTLKTEIAYALNPEYHNKGYTTEALKAVIDYGFKLGLNRIEAWTMKGNDASDRVLEKSGFTLEGIHRETMYWNKKLQDLKWYSIIKSDLNI